MQVSVEANGPLERSLTVEVPEEHISSAVEERLGSMRKTSRIQGFRPGKAPLRVLRQRFGTRVRNEVVEKLVGSSFIEAVNQEGLKPVGRPLIDPVREQVGSGLSYTATFEVLPDIRLNPLEDLRVEKPVCRIEHADIDNTIETLRWRRREFRVVTRAAGQGDRVNVDYQGVVEGVVLEDVKSEDVNVEIGQGLFIAGLEPGLEGASAGQSLELPLAFPPDFGNRDLAGKPVLFQVQVNRVEEVVLPGLDEEFFATFGVSKGGEQAFRRRIREHVELEVDTALRNRYRDSIMKALHEANDIDVPKVLVNAELERMQSALEAGLGVRGPYREVASQLTSANRLQSKAQRQVALHLLTTEIIRSKGLRAKPEKVREIIESRAQSYEDSAACINWHYSDEKRLAEIESLALEDEVLDCITALARVEEVSLSFDELMN